MSSSQHLVFCMEISLEGHQSLSGRRVNAATSTCVICMTRGGRTVFNCRVEGVQCSVVCDPNTLDFRQVRNSTLDVSHMGRVFCWRSITLSYTRHAGKWLRWSACGSPLRVSKQLVFIPASFEHAIGNPTPNIQANARPRTRYSLGDLE